MPKLSSYSAKTSLTGADKIPLTDSADSSNTKNITWTNLVTAITSALSGVYQPVGSYLTSLAGAVLTSQTSGQTIGDTTNRLTKLWATDITCTNAIAADITGSSASCTGNAATSSSCSGNAATATTASACSGNSATATTASACSGNAATATSAGSVTNATLTTALTVNTGTVTLTGNVANTSALTIGAGAVSVSGTNTGDNAANSSCIATSLVTRATFADGDLAAGILTITHNLALSAPYSLNVAFFDNNAKQVFPDVTGLTNTLTADFTNFGAITGNYGYVYLKI